MSTTFMYRISKAVLSVVLLIAVAGYGQSLGEAARDNRLKKDKNAPAAKKIVTTDDVSTEATPESPKPYKTIGTSSFTPEMWKSAIEGKIKWIAFLEAEKDKLEAQPKLDMKQVALDPKARKQWEELGIQKQFASEIPEQKKELLEMREQARKAGVPLEVWNAQ